MHKGKKCVKVRQERTVEAGALEAKVDSVKAANGPARFNEQHHRFRVRVSACITRC